MTRPSRDVSCAETPHPLTNAARQPSQTSLRLGNQQYRGATEGPNGLNGLDGGRSGRLSSGLEHVTFITCSKHPCHSLALL